MIQVETCDGQRHYWTENAAVDELVRTALQESERQAKEVINCIGMLAQFADVLDVFTVLNDEIERLGSEHLHHVNEAGLVDAFGAEYVDENAAQVEEARVVIHLINTNNL